MVINQYNDRAWGLVHTKSRHEKQVVSVLNNSGLPAYLPCVFKKHESGYIGRLPMFRCYLFAAWNSSERSRLRYCSGVADFYETQLNCDGEIIQQLQQLVKLEELSKSQDVNLLEMPMAEHTNENSFLGIPGKWLGTGSSRLFSTSLNVMGLTLNATIAEAGTSTDFRR